MGTYFDLKVTPVISEDEQRTCLNHLRIFLTTFFFLKETGVA